MKEFNLISNLSKKIVKNKICYEIEEIIQDSIIKGAYVFFESISTKPYIGQSKHVKTRLNQHLNGVRLHLEKLDDVLLKVGLKGFNKEDREVFEHLLLEALGGKDETANTRNPIGKKRQDLLKKFKETFEFCD